MSTEAISELMEQTTLQPSHNQRLVGARRTWTFGLSSLSLDGGANLPLLTGGSSSIQLQVSG